MLVCVYDVQCSLWLIPKILVLRRFAEQDATYQSAAAWSKKRLSNLNTACSSSKPYFTCLVHDSCWVVFFCVWLRCDSGVCLWSVVICTFICMVHGLGICATHVPHVQQPYNWGHFLFCFFIYYLCIFIIYLIIMTVLSSPASWETNHDLDIVLNRIVYTGFMVCCLKPQQVLGSSLRNYPFPHCCWLRNTYSGFPDRFWVLNNLQLFGKRIKVPVFYILTHHLSENQKSEMAPPHWWARVQKKRWMMLTRLQIKTTQTPAVSIAKQWTLQHGLYLETVYKILSILMTNSYLKNVPECLHWFLLPSKHYCCLWGMVLHLRGSHRAADLRSAASSSWAANFQVY